MKIVYLFGAGASASIDERVPVMANFFEKAIDLLDNNNKTFLIAFAFAEEARAFPSNPEVESLGIQMGTIARLLERSDRAGIHSSLLSQRSSLLREELADAISTYKETFKKEPNRNIANLEDVFSKAEAFKKKSSAADQTYDRLQYVINGLFNQLDKEVHVSFQNAAHHNISQFVANTAELEHIFISFNYDLWLEKALFQGQVWYPRDGHGSYSFEYYSKPADDSFPKSGVLVRDVLNANKFVGEHQKSRVGVLKPHGSLSWRFSTKNNKRRENGLIILEKDEFSCVAYNNTWSFPSANFSQRGTELTLVPLITPPAPNKIRSHPLFWETDKDVYNALLHADILVIVGWSMPLTDRYLQDTILRALNARENQIRKLIVCDMPAAEGHLLSRFENIFRPREIKGWFHGFNWGFVDILKKEL
jgi:hypothetical protein